MRPSYDDIDDLDLDFADNNTARQLMRERIHELRRLASRRATGPGNKREYDDFDDDDDDYDDDYEDYEDYDDDEFDSYSDNRYQ